jgi:uncharacterized protein (TIGR03067 family)
MCRKVMSNLVIALSAPLLFTATVNADEPSTPSPKEIKAAVDKALPLLLKGAEGHIEEKTCFSCHNQTLPVLAFTTAKERGFSVPDMDMKKHMEFIAEFLGTNKENYLRGKGQGGKVDTAGYAMFTLELGGWKADATTEAVVEYLLQHDKELDHWLSAGRRAPAGSDFTPTFLALRAMNKWGTPKQKQRITNRVDIVREWLLKTAAQDTEDSVFRLWALQAAGAEEKEIRSAREDLVKMQRADGGWGQTEKMDSDAYATGSVLVVLHQAGSLATTDRVYQRGVAFLLKTQHSDGSWLVHTHSKPIQTYYESGFPHGKDQFISITATGWATTALALTCAVQANEETLNKELQAFTGTWKLISREVNGKKAREQDIKGLLMSHNGTDKFSVRHADKMIAEATFKFDPTKKPRTIDMTFTEGENQGKTVLGIYEIEGDTIRVCHASPGGERPTEFSTKAGSGHVHIVYQREKQ